MHRRSQLMTINAMEQGERNFFFFFFCKVVRRYVVQVIQWLIFMFVFKNKNKTNKQTNKNNNNNKTTPG